jgi:hypothetical protein
MNDVLGWQNTRWGMTEKEIIEAVSMENLQISQPQNFEGSYSTLSITNTKIGDFYFDVLFQMSKEDDCLIRVLIRCEELKPDGYPARQFTAAKKILSERFGQPTRVGTTDDFQWKFPTTTITLSVIFIADLYSLVAISFMPTGSVSPSISAF